MTSQSKQLSTKLKTTTTAIFLRSRQTVTLQNENTPTIPNEAAKNEELVNITKKAVKEEPKEHEKEFSSILI